ncbi:glutathione S-transferase family protein [Hahella aquimaris]|uniref:glutathione S-transferase family protein n=1 Tax=Hahella sp. HNIBRBA332 TaxID=3015983 RepID=UPI00273CD25E|nr:glutathione S-transferase family protein [Hahella sp. HNIBRBA332]WLQ13656.1 glutathione S-transferase family protein [Hahella sp. HNIBRBA332]
MKIYQARIAPNPRRVRIFLAEKDIAMEYVEVDIQKGEQHSPEFKQKNALGLLPVLELDDGSHLSESIAICRYFEEIQSEPPLFGRDAKEKAIVEMWIRRCDFYFMFPTGMCFQNTSDYFKGLKRQVPEWGELCREKSGKFFNLLNNHFEHNAYLAGDYFSIADISAFCTVDFAKVIQQRIQPEHTHLQRWYEAVAARPSSKA